MRQKRLLIQVFAGGDEHKELNKYASYVSTLFTFNLPTVSIKKTGKLSVEFLDEDDAFYIFPADRGQSIYTVRETFPFRDFTGTDLDKLTLLAKKAIYPLTKLYEHLGLNPADVIWGHKTILENNFNLKVNFIKERNRQGTTAILTVEYFLNFALVFISFFNKDGLVIKKVDLFKTLPHYLFYSQLIHSAKWINNDTIQIVNKSKESRININVDGETSIKYYPVGRDIEGIKEEIRYFSLAQMIDIDAGKNCNMKLLD